ncbi:T9SS type A sorting domain-containing protein [bacterium]|nr:T9SS type A sorting domain-containing protein [bacterium]MBU1153598.1 T9SS type A sorting domain-containing protein [bacterium]
MSIKRLLLPLLICSILFPFLSQAEVGDIYTIAGDGMSNFYGDGGPAISASLRSPSGITIDKEDNLYLADTLNHRIRKIDKNGIIVTIAGNGIVGFSGDGDLATRASLSEPVSICLDQKENIYFSDSKNHRIRKIDKNGIITTIAGNGIVGFSGDGDLATKASLYLPYGIFIDKEDNLYICDSFNHRLRKVNQDGIIVTVAGNGEEGYDGDNKDALSSKLRYPHGVLVNSFGDIYITHTCNSRIRKVDTKGIITTIAGNNQEGYSGDNLLAISTSLRKPTEIFMDTIGNLYICDSFNHRLRKINQDGIITTFAGNGKAGFSGENNPALEASLNYPYSLTMDSQGNFYFSDQANNRIRKIVGASLNKAPLVTVISPNGKEAIKGNFIVNWKVTDENLSDLHHFNILLSLDGGVSYPITVVSNLQETTYLWDTSGYSSDKAKIKVIARDNGLPPLKGEDESDDIFFLNNNLPPCIEMIKPPLGETKACYDYLVTWEDLDIDDNATITLYWDKDRDWFNNLTSLEGITWGKIISGIKEDDQDQNNLEKDAYLLDVSLIPSWYPWQRYCYIWGKIDDGINMPFYDCSQGRIIIYTQAKIGGMTKSTSGATIEINANALEEDAYVFVVNNPEDHSIKVANYKLTLNSNLHLSEILEKSIHEFKAVGMHGNLLTLSSKIQVNQTEGVTYITLPYDEEVIGQLKTNEDNLKIYYLNKEEQRWEKLSYSQTIDKLARKIKTQINKLGIYGIIEEVSNNVSIKSISLYPNPLNLTKTAEHKITFGRIVNFTKIEIYNIAGELIKTIEDKEDTPSWDITNKYSQVVGSGVYLYLVFDKGRVVSKGKIAIIN